MSSLIISILILESILRISSNIISRELLTYFPSTNVKKKLLKEKGFIINENLYKTIKIQNYEFKYYLNSFPSIDDEAILNLELQVYFILKMVFVINKQIFLNQKLLLLETLSLIALQ